MSALALVAALLAAPTPANTPPAPGSLAPPTATRTTSSAAGLRAEPGRAVVALLELGGAAAERVAFGARLAQAIRRLPGVELLAWLDLEALIGADAADALLRCPDDACIVARLPGLTARQLVLGRVEPARAGVRVELRLVDRAAPLEPRARIVREQQDVDAIALERLALEVAAELFPRQAARAGARVEVRTSPADVSVELDGQPLGVAPLAPFVVAPGPHTLRLSRAGYAPRTEAFTARAGEALGLDLALDARRSTWPLWVAGVGLAAVGGGVALGVASNDVAAPWVDGCSATTCGAGLTLERYRADVSTQDTLRVGAGVALGAGGAALLTALAGWLFDLDTGADDAPAADVVPAPTAALGATGATGATGASDAAAATSTRALDRPRTEEAP